MTRDRRSQDTLSDFTTYKASSTRIAEDTKENQRDTTSPSLVRASTMSEVEIDQYPILQIQGVVPGIRRAQQLTSSTHSLVLPLLTANDALIANTPLSIQDGAAIHSMTATQTTYSTTSRRSNYPRTSPLCFLYPVFIVPYTFPPAPSSTSSSEHTRFAYTEALQQNILTPPMISKIQRSDAPLSASLPLSLKLLFLITLSVIVLGVICILLAFCINFPPGTWAIFRSERCDSDATIVEYTTNHQTEAETELHAYNNDGTAHYDRQQGKTTDTAITQPSSSHRRHSYTPQDDAVSVGFSPRHSLPAASSPYNPFLDPPGVQRPGRVYRVKVRSSNEWREAHAAFFGGVGDEDTAKATTAVEAKTEARGVGEDGNASAMELKENEDDERSGEDTLVSKGVTWMDQRLGMLDDAVDEAAARIAKWTEDQNLD